MSTINEVKEQIQIDLDCLFDGFNVGHLQNNEAQSLYYLACQIVVDNFAKLNPDNSQPVVTSKL